MMVFGEKLCSRGSVGVVRQSCAGAQGAQILLPVSFLTKSQLPNLCGIVASAFSPQKIDAKAVNITNTSNFPFPAVFNIRLSYCPAKNTRAHLTLSTADMENVQVGEACLIGVSKNN